MYLLHKIIPKDQLTIIFTATKHHSEFIHALLQVEPTLPVYFLKRFSLQRNR